MSEPSNKYKIIKAKVANDWRVLEHVPGGLQDEELCMIAIEQDWRALDFVANKTEKICMKTWDICYAKHEDTAEVFKCVMRNLGFEEQESKTPVSTVEDMVSSIEAVKSLRNAVKHEATAVFEAATVSTAKTINKVKTKLSGLLVNKGKVSSLLKNRKIPKK